jgi:hypothetical protein
MDGQKNRKEWFQKIFFNNLVKIRKTNRFFVFKLVSFFCPDSSSQLSSTVSGLTLLLLISIIFCPFDLQKCEYTLPSPRLLFLAKSIRRDEQLSLLCLPDFWEFIGFPMHYDTTPQPDPHLPFNWHNRVPVLHLAIQHKTAYWGKRPSAPSIYY